MNLDSHILQVLNANSAQARAVTIGDLARHFGVGATIVMPAARRLVESGQAEGIMSDVHGVPTLRALVPVSAKTAAEPVPTPAAVPAAE